MCKAHVHMHARSGTLHADLVGVQMKMRRDEDDQRDLSCARASETPRPNQKSHSDTPSMLLLVAPATRAH